MIFVSKTWLCTTPLRGLSSMVAPIYLAFLNTSGSDSRSSFFSMKCMCGWFSHSLMPAPETVTSWANPLFSSFIPFKNAA